VQEVINGVTRNWSYGYDGLDRLSSASVDGTNPSIETYGYDIFGNRTSKANSTSNLAYIFDAAHQLSQIRTGSTAGPLSGQLTGAAVHDGSGRMIKLCEGASISVSNGAAANDCTASGANASTLSMAYNALDQLLSASRTGTNPANETYAYDDQGRRISKTSGGVQTNNLYNGDAIHSQWVSSPSNTPTAVMVHGTGIDEPLMRLSGTTNTPNATARFYMSDGLGSVIGQVDENGANPQSQRFDAWGSATNATNPSGINTTPPYGFTGREPDGTGLIHYRARNYLPGLGIFTSRDPAGMVDAVSPYAYVGNRPTTAVDPEGEAAMQVAGGVVGGVGGLLFQAGSDLLRGRLSSRAEYAGAITGGAAGGIAATLCGPGCAGATASAVSNATTQLLGESRFSVSSLVLDTALGAVGGRVVGAVLPPAAKAGLSNGVKGDIGETLSEIGLRATGQNFTRQVENGVGRSTFDFKLNNGSFVESKFGTSNLSSPQRQAARQQGDNLEVHRWTYPTVSGLAATGPAAALGVGSEDFGPTNQSLSGTTSLPTGGASYTAPASGTNAVRSGK
jgi:RHS repeat-associated protein